jgi:hypothetical protein
MTSARRRQRRLVVREQVSHVGDVDLDEAVHGHDAGADSDGGRDRPSAGRERLDVQAEVRTRS